MLACAHKAVFAKNVRAWVLCKLGESFLHTDIVNIGSKICTMKNGFFHIFRQFSCPSVKPQRSTLAHGTKFVRCPSVDSENATFYTWTYGHSQYWIKNLYHEKRFFSHLSPNLMSKCQTTTVHTWTSYKICTMSKCGLLQFDTWT